MITDLLVGIVIGFAFVGGLFACYFLFRQLARESRGHGWENYGPPSRLEVVNIQPGDTIIVSIPDSTELDEMEHIKQHVESRFPEHTVLVKTRSIGLEVVAEGHGQGPTT